MPASDVCLLNRHCICRNQINDTMTYRNFNEEQRQHVGALSLMDVTR